MRRLKELRIQHGLLQKDVAIKLGVDRTTYVKYENGKSEPNNETLQKLADIFNTSTDYILGREEKKTAQSELPLPNEIDAIVASCSKLSLEKLKVILDICRILNQEQDS